MSKNTFISVGLMLLLCTSAQLAAEERPDIVLAITDDQGWRESIESESPEPAEFFEIHVQYCLS